MTDDKHANTPDDKHANTPAKKPVWFSYLIRLRNTPENRAIFAKTKAYAALNGMTIADWYLEAMKSYHTEQRKNPNFRSVVEDGE